MNHPQDKENQRMCFRQASLLVVLLCLTAAAPSAPVIDIQQGRLSGTSDAGIEVFRGIPYAQPPIGALRWHAPETALPWSNTRTATNFGHACLQEPRPSLGTAPSEDCLYLNVWRPSVIPAPIPVLLWIHGGGDLGGAASQPVYDGSAFARRGLVFVSFNYRLGRAGFFDHPALERAHEGTVGNFAIMDMLAALRWVQSNAAAFGGDPHRVTLMGESSGAASEIALLISPQARGLFSQAIVLSGASRDFTLGGLTAVGGFDNAATRGLRFAQQHGIDGTDADALLKLRELPIDALLADADIGLGDHTTYTGGEIQDGSIIPSAPQAAFERGRANFVPTLVGSTSQELPAIGPTCVNDPLGFFVENEAIARRLYAAVPAAELGSTLSGNVAMNEPARFLADVMTKHGQPAWLYRFSYVRTADRATQPLAAHGSDNAFTFDTVAQRAASPEDEAMAQTVNAFYANFALHQNPNAPGLPLWKQFTANDDDLMNFTADRGARFERDPIADNINLITHARASRGMTYRTALPATNFIFGCK
jgi:para-nitrobenzyl esterase